MVASSGLSAQLGIAEEGGGSYGTYAAPTLFQEFVDEGIKYVSNRIESQGIRGGRRIGHRWAQGTRKAEGPISMELANETVGLWLKHGIGAPNTSGGGDPYTHTYTPGDIDGDMGQAIVGGQVAEGAGSDPWDGEDADRSHGEGDGDDRGKQAGGGPPHGADEAHHRRPPIH